MEKQETRAPPLGPKDRRSYGRTVVQHCRLDVVAAVFRTALDLLKDIPLQLIAAQGQRLRLRQGDDAECQRRPCLLAQAVERQTPLDGGLAQAGLRRHIVERRALVDQSGERRRFLQRCQILPLQVFNSGDAWFAGDSPLEESGFEPLIPLNVIPKVP
jgi:hypothetical protein